MLLLLLAGARGGQAQSVLTPPPLLSVAPIAQQQFEASEMGVVQPASPVAGFSLGTLPFQWGPVDLHPHMLYRALYGDGLLSSPGQPQRTFIQEVSPGILFNLGTHWSLDYTPTLRFYSNNQFRDGLDHSVSLNGWGAYEDWVLGFSQGCGISSTPRIETGTQTDQESYSTALSASYRFNSKMSLDLGIGQSFVLADQFASSRDWSTMDWLNYQFWPRLDAGLGAGFEFTDVDTGSDMTSEKLQARISWRVTDKTSLLLHGGLEDRQFLSGGVGDLLNPIFGASIQYQPLDGTTFSLSADRTVTASYFTNQVSETTSVSAGLNQRLLKKLNLSLGAGYSTATYVSSKHGQLPLGGYDSYSFNARLSVPILKHGTLSATYQFSDNSSAVHGLSFTSSQVGLEIQYGY